MVEIGIVSPDRVSNAQIRGRVHSLGKDMLTMMKDRNIHPDATT
jgi:hypothetical protein